MEEAEVITAAPERAEPETPGPGAGGVTRNQSLQFFSCCRRMPEALVERKETPGPIAGPPPSSGSGTRTVPRSTNQRFCRCFYLIYRECAEDLSKTALPAVVYMLIMVLICFVFIINWYSETNGSFSITSSSVEWLISIYMMIGVLGIGYCFYHRRDTDFVKFDQLEEEDHSSKYLMAGVYAFGSGSLFMTTLYLFAYAHCSEQVCDVIFNAVRFMFTLVQILFLQRFSLSTFRRSAGILFLLYHVLGTNLCVWIFHLVEETHVLGKEPPDDKHQYCLKNNKVTKMMSGWNEYMTPFTLEYCLISAGMLYAMGSNMRYFPGDKISATRKTERKGKVKYTSMGERSSSPSSVADDDHCEPKRHNSDETASLRSSQPKYRFVGSHPGVLVGIAASIIMIVSALVIEQDDVVSFSLLFHFIFLTSVCITQLVAMWTMTDALTNHERKWHKLRADDTLLIISGIGLIAWDILCLIASLSAFQQEYPDNMIAGAIFVFILANFLTALIQLFVIIRTQRFKTKLKENKKHLVWQEVVVESSTSGLSQASLFLLMTNLGFWALDSFFEIKGFATVYYPVGPRFYRKNWNFWSALLYPLAIFFRFHSATLMFDIWSKFYKESCKSEEDVLPLMRRSSLPSDESPSRQLSRHVSIPPDVSFAKQFSIMGNRRIVPSSWSYPVSSHRSKSQI